MRARPQGIARGWVALVLAGVLLACSGASFAQRTEGDRASARGAYEAEVAVRNQTEGERERAFARALGQVLANVTGDSSVTQRPGEWRRMIPACMAL